MCLYLPKSKAKLLFRAETEMQPCGSRGGKVCPALLDHEVIPRVVPLFIVKQQQDPESYCLSSQHFPSTSTLSNLFPSFFTLGYNSKLKGKKTGLHPKSTPPQKLRLISSAATPPFNSTILSTLKPQQKHVCHG